MNGKVTEVMKKHLLFVGLSYALLTACWTPVSLTDNYFEDENYYNPTLPSPNFAAPSSSPTPSDDLPMDYGQYWGDNNDLDQGAEVIRPGGGFNGNWSPSMRINSINAPSFWQWRLMQQQFMFGNTPYGFNPYSRNNMWQGGMWNDPWNFYDHSYGNGWQDPWNPFGYGYGYGYGFGYGNPYGWNNSYGNGWSNGNNGWSNGNTTTRSGTNYGGRRPSKYNTSRGNSSSTGRTTDTPTAPSEPTGWGGTITPIKTRTKIDLDQNEPLQPGGRLKSRNVRRVTPSTPSTQPSNTPGNKSVKERRTRTRTTYNSYDRISSGRSSTMQPSSAPQRSSSPQRSVTPQRTSSPQPSSRPQRSTSNSNSSGRRR